MDNLTCATYLLPIMRDPLYQVEKVKVLLDTSKIPDFNCFVGRGLSGVLGATLFSSHLNKRLLIVRKEGENSHSSQTVEGYVGGPYVIVDDLVSTGTTIHTILKKLKTVHTFRGLPKPIIQGIILYGESTNTDLVFSGIPVFRI